MTRDKDLPPNWPDDWPQNLEEFEKILQSDAFVSYCESKGMYLKIDKKNRTVKVMNPGDVIRKSLK